MRSNAGQGIIEYILVLVVVVAIILGGIYQLNSAFAAWAHNYFGDYLSCLLETGDLPSLGGPSDTTAGVCNQLYKPFTLADGRPLIDDGGSSGDTDDTDNGPGSPGVKDSGSSHLVQAGGGGGADSEFGHSPSRFLASNANESGGGGSSKKLYTGSTGVSTPSWVQNGSANSSQNHNDKKFDRGFYVEMPKDEKERTPSSFPSTAKKSQAGKKKNSTELHKSNLKKTEDNADTRFTIGGFLRFLIIAAIVIALLLLLGGQALQIGKSMD